MKRQHINKLYSKLTPHEQANLAFEAAMRHDEKDVDLILNSVEQKTYVTGHADYHTRNHGLIQLSGIFGIAYWKTFFKLSTAQLDKTGQAFDKITQQHINEFIALNTALNNVCETLQMNPEAVRKYAECHGINPNFKGTADNQFTEKYTELFTMAANLTTNQAITE